MMGIEPRVCEAHVFSHQATLPVSTYTQVAQAMQLSWQSIHQASSKLWVQSQNGINMGRWPTEKTSAPGR